MRVISHKSLALYANTLPLASSARIIQTDSLLTIAQIRPFKTFNLLADDSLRSAKVRVRFLNNHMQPITQLDSSNTEPVGDLKTKISNQIHYPVAVDMAFFPREVTPHPMTQTLHTQQTKHEQS